MSCRNKQTNAPSLGRTNSTKSWMKTNINRAIARAENILIEQSFNSSVTPKPTCNRRLLFCSWLLFRCTTTTTKRHSNCNGLSQTNFTKTKASRINLQREIKKTRGLTVQFGPDASKAALQQRPDHSLFLGNHTWFETSSTIIWIQHD